MSHKLALAVCLVICATHPCFADDAVSLTVGHTDSVDLHAFNVPAVTLSSQSNIDKSLLGVEQSQCQPYGRQSNSSASATFNQLGASNQEVKVALGAKVYAQGGHYRTWVYNQAPVCIGFKGNDTSATASAESKAVVTIAFNPDFKHPAAYQLSVSLQSDGNKPDISLKDSKGVLLGSLDVTGKPYVLHGQPGSVYFLEIDLKANASNAGGCCNDTAAGSSTLDVRLDPAPLIATAYLEGYIKGGNQTTSYKNVGALILDGDIHCTGTLIAPRTVLTAAHCLAGHEGDTAKLTFALGSNYQQPDYPPAGVVGIDYPRGELGFKFNPKTFEDDIGLVYLDRSFPVQVSQLFADNPTWDTIAKDQTSLIFVGFGYNVVSGDKVGSGIKREGAWIISVVENRRVGFSVAGKSTCGGDSGGPAFFETDAALLVAGLTSTGNDDCSIGYETRVDAYSTWLAGRTR